MDREIQAPERRRRITRIAITTAVALAVVIFSLAATIQWLRPSIRRADLEMARVERGSVDATLQASGTVQPALEQVVSAPVEARVLRIDRHAGDRVHAGDEIVTLDTSAAHGDADRLSDQVAQKDSELAELRLRIEETLATARATIEQKQLDADIFRFKAEQNRKLHSEGLVAAQEDLVAAAAAKKSTIELDQLRQGLERSRRTGDAQIAAASASLRVLTNQRDEARRQLDLAMMRADRDGVVTWIVPDAGAMLHRGDAVARIADLSSFRVVATVSDLYASALSPGLKVRVKVDDSTTIGGAITNVEPRMEGGIARFTIALDDPSNHNLRSNARVDVYVVTGAIANVLRVRRGTLAQSASEDVFVVRGTDLVATPVRWGLTGEETAAVASGLRAGDQVVISNMTDYNGVKRLRLK